MKSPPRAKLERNSHILPIAIGVLLFLTFTYPHRSWLILLVGFGLLWLSGYLWARSLAQGLWISRRMRYGWAQVGDRLEERFVLTNRAPVAGLWIEVTDHSTMPDYHISQARGVGSRSEIHWKTAGVCTRRGVFTLGPTTIRTSDPFSLYTVTIHNPASVALTVTPPVVPLPTIEVAPGGRAGEGRPHPNALERTINAATVRNYIPGDSLKAIHWPTSARRNELFVRQFENTPAGDWWIILDLDEQTQVGQGQNSTEEHSIILAASLADRGLRAGRAVGLMAYSKTLIWLPPQHGDSQRQRILQALALAQSGECSLAELLAYPALGRLASLIIITPNTDSLWIESLSALLRNNAVATVLLLDPIAFGGERDVGPISILLSDLSITHHPITPDLLDHPDNQPGKQGQWDWRISPLGRAVSVHRPGNMDWKRLRQR